MASRPCLQKNTCASSLQTDGCFADDIIAATDCTIGHRTLRTEDYGKIPATFVDTHTTIATRPASQPNLRELVAQHLPQEPRYYFAQRQTSRELPAGQTFRVALVHLTPRSNKSSTDRAYASIALRALRKSSISAKSM